MLRFFLLPKTPLIALFRSEYFKKNIDTPPREESIEVKGFSFHVLSTVVNFMYGHDIPHDFRSRDVESLLTMAELYLMEDLKLAVARLLGKRLSKDNILETYQLAEKYGAGELKEMCRDFIFSYIDFANGVLGVDLVNAVKYRRDLRDVPKYKDYMMTCMEPNMLVRCNTTSYWYIPVQRKRTVEEDGYAADEVKRALSVEKGTIGRVVSFDGTVNGISVKWESGITTWHGNLFHLDPLTSCPVDPKLFTD